MMYFVPAWYNASRPWYTTDNIWYQRTEVMDFDDITSQLRIFQQTNDEVELLVLNYSPNLRRFLHRQNLLDVNYWSFFDELQGFHHDYVKPLNYLELSWPEDASFHFNPFIVTVMRDRELYAKIYLSNDGTLLSIRYYVTEIPIYENIYDDRGFLSSMLMYDEHGQPDIQSYHNRQDDWVFVEFLKTGNITMNPDYLQEHQKGNYANYEEMITDHLKIHLQEHNTKADTLVLALHQQHNNLIYNALDKQTLVLSLFKGRNNDVSEELQQRTQAVFSDSHNDDGKNFGNLPVLRIYPYYNRRTFGASSYESVLYISLFVDNISLEEVEAAIMVIMKQLQENPDTQLLLCTFKVTNIAYIKQLKDLVSKYNAKVLSERIQIGMLSRTAELMQMIAKSRVFLDLGKTINNHLSTEAIDSGVPQINRYENGFTVHKKNGYTITAMEDIEEALNYFLIGLQNWNESLVFYTQMIAENADQAIAKRWETLKEELVHESITNQL